MSDDALLSAFDDCLHELEVGATLDEALRHAPTELVDDLRPMLEAAAFARITVPAQPSPSAQAASRTRFLSLAQEARRARKRSLWAWLFAPTPQAVKRRSFALQLASLVFIGAATLGTAVTVNAAGNAMPGDLLYGVKLTVEDMQLALAPQPASREALEAQFDARRIQEAQALLASRREASITFAGDIQVIDGERWVVSGVPVQVSIALGNGFSVGQQVRITGHSDASVDAIVAEQVERLGIPTLVPTLAPVTTATHRPTETQRPTDDRTATPEVEASETAIPTQRVLPTATATFPAPTATTNTGGPAPSATPKTEDHGGGATHTPEAENTEKPDDDDDHGGSQVTNTPQPTDDHSGSGATNTPQPTDDHSGSGATNTPQPTDDHSGSGGGDHSEPTKTPKP